MIKKLFPLFLLLVLMGAGCTASKQATGTSDGGILKSVNAGKDWAPSATVLTAKGVGTLMTANVLGLEMDPSDKTVIYANTREDGFLYSEDAGTTWRQPRFEALATGLVTRVSVDPKQTCTVYVAKGQRLYKTTDCMRTFDSEVFVESRPDVLITLVEVDWFDSQTVWLGLQNGDVLKSQDGGTTWTTILQTGKEISDILVSNTDSRIVLISFYNGAIQKTTDGGATWTDLSPALKKWTDAKKVYDMAQHAKSGALLIGTQYGLLKSTDLGNSWEALNLVTSKGQSLVRAVAFDSTNETTIYYATVGAFYKSIDNGASWQTEKLPSTRVPRSLLVDPKAGGVIYIGFAKDIEN